MQNINFALYIGFMLPSSLGAYAYHSSFLRGGGSITPEFNFGGEYRSETTYTPSRRYLHIHGCTPAQ
jgi:hypothetical protein